MRSTPSNLCHLLLATGVSMLLMSCEDPGVDGLEQDPPTSDTSPVTSTTRLLPDTEYTRGLEIYEHVRVLGESHVQGIEKTPTTLSLDASANADRTYSVGDVLVSDRADGIFRVVESVEVQGQRILMTTRPAKLEEAVASGEIYVAKLADETRSVPSSFQTALDTTSTGLLTRSQGLDFNGGWRDALYTYESSFAERIDQRLGDDHIEVSRADVSAEIGAEVYANIQAQRTQPRTVNFAEGRLTTNGQVTGTIGLRVQSDEAFSSDHTITLFGPASSDPIQVIEPRTHTLLPDLFPLLFTFSARSDLQIVASADGQVEAEVGYTVVTDAYAGTERADNAWRLVRGADVSSPQTHGPIYSGEHDVNATARFTTGMEIVIGESANGFMRIRPAEVTAEYSQQIDPGTGSCPTSVTMNAKARMQGQLESIQIPVLGEQTVQDGVVTRTLFDEDILQFDEQLDQPGVCDPDYVAPTHDRTQLPGQACVADVECVATADCFERTCVRRGDDFRVSAAWYAPTDGDIFVKTPSGATIHYGRLRADAGSLGETTCSRGECTSQGPHVENVYFGEDAPDGTYQVWLKNSDGRAGSAANFEIRMGERKLEFSGVLPAESGARSEVFEFVRAGGKLDIEGVIAIGDRDYAPEPNTPANIDVEGSRYYKDIAYRDNNEIRNTFDIILPEATQPVPLVIYVHGGGFRQNDKSQAYNDKKSSAVNAFLEAGVAHASINYRLLEEQGETQGVRKPLFDSARAVQFMRHHAQTLGIDPDRIAIYGSSAGAGTSLMIGTHDDLADSTASDPVERASTRVRAIGIFETQASYDIARWEDDVFAEFGLTLEMLWRDVNLTQTILRFYGITSPDRFYDLDIRRYRDRVDMLDLMSSDDPPIWIESVDVPGRNPRRSTSALLHHPNHARTVYNEAKAKNIEVRAYIPKLEINDGVPEGDDQIVPFFIDLLTR